MTALPKLRWMALPITVGLGVINLSPEPSSLVQVGGNKQTIQNQ
ncbi:MULTISPECIES: hypothetical protein [unclassified Nodularia (in: cyanobacteria)]|nr:MULTISPECIES: hypothetical protein [unclassified Nodularia (in: cyanobacteria)]